jgi:membrane-anchored protein YejM (alkaline phosphatase superfamily)
MARYETNRDLFHEFNNQTYSAAASIQHLALLTPAQEHILTQEQEKAAETVLEQVEVLCKGWAA